MSQEPCSICYTCIILDNTSSSDNSMLFILLVAPTLGVETEIQGGYGLAQGHITGEWWYQGSNTRVLTPEPKFLSNCVANVCVFTVSLPTISIKNYHPFLFGCYYNISSKSPKALLMWHIPWKLSNVNGMNQKLLCAMKCTVC